MEILGPEFINIALRVSLVLGALSVIVLAATVAVRIGAGNKIKRSDRFRHRAEPLVTSFIAGRTGQDDVVQELRRDPDDSLALLMELSDRLEPAERASLRPLFASLPQAQAEIAALKSRRWETRLRAAERLGYFGNKDMVPLLRDALHDDVLAVRFAAARSLAALGDPAHVEPILLALDVPGEMNQRRVAEVLYDFGPRAVGPLLEVLWSGAGKFSDTAVGTAVRVLGMLRSREAVAPVAALLDSPEFRIRLNAVRTLGLLGDHSVIPAISALAKDPSWEVRNMVMQALGRLHAAQSIPVLTAALADQAWWVRYSAGIALYSLGDKGIEALRDTMNKSPDRYACDASRQILEEQRVIETKEALS